MLKKLPKDTKNIALIFLISIISFWQVISLRNCLKWDFIDLSMPWRFFIGENIQNGFLPLWVPYSKLGFPLYFDPQTWYPISWFIGLTTGYNVFVIQAEFVFHIFLAGIGMYIFSKHFTDDKKLSLLAAVVFMLSGFFVSNAQHLGWMVSGAWVPFVLNSYLNIYKKKKILPVLSFSLFLFLLFTGGYFPFTIISIYIAAGIFIYKTILFLRNKQYSKIKTNIFRHILSLIIFISVSLVVLLSLNETKNYIGRGRGLSLEQVLQHSLEPQSFITFAFPFASMFGGTDFWGSDISVINSYFGLIPFLILIFGLFIRKSKIEFTFLILGILAFMITLGNVLPIRKIFYYTLPFFKYFRFPSLFRYFGIFAFIIFSILTLKKVLSDKKLVQCFKFYLFFVSSVLFTVLLYLFLNISSINISLENWFEYIKTISFKETIIIQGTIHFIFLLALLYVLFLKKEVAFKFNIISGLIIINMIISIQLNAPRTIFSDISAKELQKNLDKLPSGFPIPDINQKIIDSKNMKSFSPVWRNLNFFYKNPSHKGYGPYQLNNFTNLERSGLLNELISNPILYFAKNFHPITGALDTAFIKKNSDGIVLTDNYDLISAKLEKNIGDKIIINSFTPKSIEAKIICKEETFIVFEQNYKNDWQAYVDNEKVKIHLVNISLQGIRVPKGSHTIKFSFENKKITNAFYFSSLVFIALLIYIVILLLNLKWNKKTL